MNTHRIGCVCASVALALLPVTPAAAQVSPANRADGRCLAAMSMTGDQASRADKGSFETGMMFFMGKIVGRAGSGALGAAVEAGSAGLSAANAPGIAQQCSTQIETASNAM